MSAIARAIRPLPSSKGWMVTNQRCARAALSTGSIAGGPLNQSRNCRHLRREPVACRRLVVDPLLADRSRDDLHRARAVVPPGPDPDPVHAAAPGREQGGVPAEQAFLRQRVRRSSGWRRASSRRRLRRRRSAGVSAPISSPRRRAREERTWSTVEDLALDLARFQDVLGQGVEDGLFAEPEAQALHPADQPCPAGDAPPRVWPKALVIPPEVWPIISFMDVHCYSPHFLRR